MALPSTSHGTSGRRASLESRRLSACPSGRGCSTPLFKAGLSAPALDECWAKCQCALRRLMQIARNMDDFDGRPRRMAMDTYERPRQIVVSSLDNAVTVLRRIEVFSDVLHSGSHVWHLAKPDR